MPETCEICDSVTNNNGTGMLMKPLPVHESSKMGALVVSCLLLQIAYVLSGPVNHDSSKCNAIKNQEWVACANCVSTCQKTVSQNVTPKPGCACKIGYILDEVVKKCYTLEEAKTKCSASQNSVTKTTGKETATSESPTTYTILGSVVAETDVHVAGGHKGQVAVTEQSDNEGSKNITTTAKIGMTVKSAVTSKHGKPTTDDPTLTTTSGSDDEEARDDAEDEGDDEYATEPAEDEDDIPDDSTDEPTTTWKRDKRAARRGPIHLNDGFVITVNGEKHRSKRWLLERFPGPRPRHGRYHPYDLRRGFDMMVNGSPVRVSN